ncbi:MAG: hypothetical protein M9898_07725 [Chitinophagaceae bacterium]|nr:hypothetical protein [Chitinophagaceae bacterium]
MERIVIEVDEDIARRWRYTSQQKRDKVSQQVNIILAKELTDSKEEFLKYLEGLRSTMKERGLTEEILEEILKDE